MSAHKPGSNPAHQNPNPSVTRPAIKPAPRAKRLEPAELATRLESLLDSLQTVQRAILEATLLQREAMRRADPAGVHAATTTQSRNTTRLAEIERDRVQLVRDAEESGLITRGTTPVTLRALASACPPEVRARLTTHASTLRTLMEEVSRETTSTRAATLTLLAHVEGVMRQVAGRLSHSGTYSRRGVVEAGSAVVSAVDVRM